MPDQLLIKFVLITCLYDIATFTLQISLSTPWAGLWVMIRFKILFIVGVVIDSKYSYINWPMFYTALVTKFTTAFAITFADLSIWYLTIADAVVFGSMPIILVCLLMKRENDQKIKFKLNQVVGEECPICYETGGLFATPPCGHRFHAHCLGSWTVEFGGTTCPVCRLQIVRTSVQI